MEPSVRPNRTEGILDALVTAILIAIVVLGAGLFAYDVLAHEPSDRDYGQQVVRVGDVEWLCLEQGGETISCETVEELE
jgi:hypothetical protein